MPKVKCRCGFIFDLTIDSPFEYVLIPENDISRLIAEADKNPVVGAQIDDSLSVNQKQVLICPSCGKILVSDDKGGYTEYQKLPPIPVDGENVYNEIDPPPTGQKRGQKRGQR